MLIAQKHGCVCPVVQERDCIGQPACRYVKGRLRNELIGMGNPPFESVRADICQHCFQPCCFRNSDGPAYLVMTVEEPIYVVLVLVDLYSGFSIQEKTGLGGSW